MRTAKVGKRENPTTTNRLFVSIETETCNLVVSPASQMRSQDSRCQLKSTKEYSPKTNASIDRMENCMTGVHFHKEQLLLFKFIYSQCQYMQCPLFFARKFFWPMRGLNNWRAIRMFLQMPWGKPYSFWNHKKIMGLNSKGAVVPFFPNFLHWAVRTEKTKLYTERFCMYWDRPLTVLLLILRPPTSCQF